MSENIATTHVLFVCLGNICRSPTAEGIFTQKVADAGLSHHFEIDSAGTSNYHPGKPPDSRSIATANKHGYLIDHLRARQICSWDFDIFDYILAMDNDNLAYLRHETPSTWQGQLSLMLDFHPSLPAGSQVPDPYLGGSKGFDHVIELLEQASDGLLQHLRIL